MDNTYGRISSVGVVVPCSHDRGERECVCERGGEERVVGRERGGEEREVGRERERDSASGKLHVHVCLMWQGVYVQCVHVYICTRTHVPLYLPSVQYLRTYMFHPVLLVSVTWMNILIIAEDKSHDLSCIISCLVQLMLDDSSRTIKGIQNLIQRCWVCAGHPFCDRLSLLETSDPEVRRPWHNTGLRDLMRGVGGSLVSVYHPNAVWMQTTYRCIW